MSEHKSVFQSRQRFQFVLWNVLRYLLDHETQGLWMEGRRQEDVDKMFAGYNSFPPIEALRRK